MTTPEPVLISLQDRGRVNLARIARHDRYLVHEEPDGTLIWEPARVLSETEARLLEHPELVATIEANRTDPGRLRRRDRSGARRAE
ncbi:MAG: hypothetical protein MUP97_17610 [Acidimicrobiia bacterium]|jgi:hypothetical protein|nr:hypothetical protein [Acidimicrobiia bacterium]